MLLHTLSCDAPFDVVFIDIWSPGEITDKYGNTKVITYLDCMTGFAMATFLQNEVNSKMVADAVLCAFFVPIGLPRLIIFNADSLFKGHFQNAFNLIQLPALPVSRENHKAVRNERFHRYLNKVQRINTADTGSLFRWKQGVLFAIYAWNAGPIDGTDLPRSVAALGREFKFPINLDTAPIADNSNSASQDALDHFEAVSLLLFRQKELLLIYNDERRKRHRDLRNQGIRAKQFAPGDLVIVQKQVKSDATKGISAKLLFCTRGPYRVVEQVTPSSYKLQKLPFLKGLGRPGRFRKENVGRMTKIPSTLVLHCLADGVDTRMLQLDGSLAQMPLQRWLGVRKPGSYQQAPDQEKYAFEPLASVWSDPDVLDNIDEHGNDNNKENNNGDENDDTQDNSDSASSGESSDESISSIQEDSGDDDYHRTRHTVHNVPRFNVNDATQRGLNKLYKDIQDSIGKLFFVAYYPTNDESNTIFWLAQVLWNESDPVQTRSAGVYWVHWFRPHHEDIKLQALVDCRFWPDTFRIKADGSRGENAPVKPSKVNHVLREYDTIRWPKENICLADTMLVGPFDFETRRIGVRGPKRKAVSQSHHIADIYWQKLEQRAPNFQISTDHIRNKPVRT